MPKFREYDLVSNTKALEDLPAGSVGTVLSVLDAERGVYVVEFVEGDGESLGVLEVEGEHLLANDD